MNKETLDKAHRILTDIHVIEMEVTELKQEIAFIDTANEHTIIVEKIIYVDDPRADDDNWGGVFGSKPQIPQRESHNYTIDKKYLTDCLYGRIAEKEKQIAELQTKFDEL